MRTCRFFITAFALVAGIWISVSTASVLQDPTNDVVTEEQLTIVGQKLAKIFSPIVRTQDRQQPRQCTPDAYAVCPLEATCGEAQVFPITYAPTNPTGRYSCYNADFCRNGSCEITIGKSSCLSACFTPGRTYNKLCTIRTVIYYRSEQMEYTISDETRIEDLSLQPYIQGCSECQSVNFVYPDDVLPGRYIVRETCAPEQEGEPLLYDFMYEHNLIRQQAEDPSTTTTTATTTSKEMPEI